MINDTTNVASYCLGNYEEIKDITDCKLIYKQVGKYYNKDKTGNIFSKALQSFKILTSNVGKLISPMPLPEDIMHTQFDNKADECKTLGYTNNYYKQEEFKETLNN